jgi:hypothetical protein
MAEDSQLPKNHKNNGSSWEDWGLTLAAKSGKKRGKNSKKCSNLPAKSKPLTRTRFKILQKLSWSKNNKKSKIQGLKPFNIARKFQNQL